LAGGASLAAGLPLEAGSGSSSSPELSNRSCDPGLPFKLRQVRRITPMHCLKRILEKGTKKNRKKNRKKIFSLIKFSRKKSVKYDQTKMTKVNA
jgi:hypothetical protein